MRGDVPADRRLAEARTRRSGSSESGIPLTTRFAVVPASRSWPTRFSAFRRLRCFSAIPIRRRPSFTSRSLSSHFPRRAESEARPLNARHLPQGAGEDVRGLDEAAARGDSAHRGSPIRLVPWSRPSTGGVPPLADRLDLRPRTDAAWSLDAAARPDMASTAMRIANRQMDTEGHRSRAPLSGR